MSVRQKEREEETENEESIVETISVPLDEEAPPRHENPLSELETGSVDIPSVDPWSCTGTRYSVSENIYEVQWLAEVPVPGFEESENAMVTLEYSTFCPNEQFNTGYAVSIIPFDEDEEPLGGFIHESIHVGTYKRLSIAAGNVENVLERLGSMEPGDEIILNEKLYTL